MIELCVFVTNQRLKRKNGDKTTKHNKGYYARDLSLSTRVTRTAHTYGDIYLI